MSELVAKNVVGHRVLVGIQLVDISRLSAHPIPFVHKGLITVAGQGPKDSNGAGKSSFIAALSLLHADPQWRLGSGAADAAELLFTAELAAQDGQWSNADRGYLIGVFADPNATTLDELHGSVLTVWLRINRKAPYVDVRWSHSLHVPLGSNDAERVAEVDALWEKLPRSNGRSDLHAGRMAGALYGDDVRCVSFLSTSVRATQTANLLAQPLNEITPERIFDAIAALTGLDKELEEEQKLRSLEHSHHVAVAETQRDIEDWERSVASVEAGIADRAAARDLLAEVQVLWRGRCARHLVDGVNRQSAIHTRLSQLDLRELELVAQLEQLEESIARLRDDKAFDEHFRGHQRRFQDLDGQRRQLESQVGSRNIEAERLATQLRDLQVKAEAAEGRTVAQASAELHQTQADWENAAAAKGIAEERSRLALEALQAAEAGEDIAVEQRRLLQDAGIPAVALTDVLNLDEPQRAVWEPRLYPYREAVVVPADRIDAALTVLHDLPGSLVIAAGPGVSTSDGSLPGCLDARFDLSGFLAELAQRSASVHVVAGFPDPITGRASRIANAREAAEQTGRQVGQARSQLDSAKRRVDLAQARYEGARAAEEATALEARLTQVRAAAVEQQERLDALQPLLWQANELYTQAMAEQQSRTQQIGFFGNDKAGKDAQLRSLREDRTLLRVEQETLDLIGREHAWGDDLASAQAYLLTLSPAEQQHDMSWWNEEACASLAAVARRCFPESMPLEQIPAEPREILHHQRWRTTGLEGRTRLAPALVRALSHYLSANEEYDRFEAHQIRSLRSQRVKDIDAARKGLTEAAEAAAVHRASLAVGIKTNLRKVADEFHRIDIAYGGHGAGLDFPEPEPPTQPDKPWRWAVTPKWRRAEGQNMAHYKLRANTAQLDEKAVKLVCAAALANGNDRPLLLVLDELGRNLGSEHRREAVALFEQIGRDRNITVVGALQDDMERYAVAASSLYVKLRRSSDLHAYNDAPVIHGSATHQAHVDLLSTWLNGFHTPAGAAFG